MYSFNCDLTLILPDVGQYGQPNFLLIDIYSNNPQTISPYTQKCQNITPVTECPTENVSDVNIFHIHKSSVTFILNDMRKTKKTLVSESEWSLEGLMDKQNPKEAPKNVAARHCATESNIWNLVIAYNALREQ